MSSNNAFNRLIEGRKGAAQCLPDDLAREQLPMLWQFLTRAQLTDDLEKDLASVSVRLGLGEWLVDLSDPGFEVSVSASSGSLEGAMRALEAVLQGPNPPLRPWKGAKGKLRKVKPKPGENS